MDKLLSTDEVAEVLGLGRRTIERYLRTRKIPAIKLGKEWKVEPADLRRYLDNLKATIPPEPDIDPPIGSLTEDIVAMTQGSWADEPRSGKEIVREMRARDRHRTAGW